MGTEVPVLSAMKTFAELVDEFAALCE